MRTLIVGAILLLESVTGFQSSTEKYLNQVSGGSGPTNPYSSQGPGGGMAYNDQQQQQQQMFYPDPRESEMALIRQESYAMQLGSPASTAIVKENGDMNIQALVDLSKEDLIVTLVNYQNWMRQYMIDAQEQKYRAIQAAEAALNDKWSEALSTMDPNATPMPLAFTQNQQSSMSLQSPLFAARNAAVSRAGAAGKSRWGDDEVQRASIQGGSSNGDAFITTVRSFNNNIEITTPSQQAARSSLNNDAIFAPSWISNPVKPSGIAAETTTSRSSTTGTDLSNINGATYAPPPSRFALDAAPVPQTSIRAAPSVPVPTEVAEADHGLRADGGVGGLTLAERVFFGATAQKSTSSASSTSPSTVSRGPSPPPPLPQPPSRTMNNGAGTAGGAATLVLSPSEILYTQRNLRLLRAAQQFGQSPRWGDPEINRISYIVASMSPEVLSAAASNTYSSPPSSARTAGSPSYSSMDSRSFNLGASIVSTQ